MAAVFLFVSQISIAQFHYTKEWDHRFGGSNNDKLEMFRQTRDNGYILGGLSYSVISGDKSEALRGATDFWVVKTDANGIKEWDKTFGGNHYDDLRDIRQTSDGGYILGGTSRSGANGDKTQPNWDTASVSTPTPDYWIVKIDSLGNKEWDKRFGGIYEDIFTCILQTSDNGFLVGGYSQGNITGDRSQVSQGGPDYWIVKTDSLGNKQWDRRYGGNRNDQLYAMDATHDGGYILGGFSWSDSSGDKSVSNWGLVNYSDFWVIKIDANGNKQWDNRYGGTKNDNLYSIQQTQDGGYILGGTSWSDISGDKTETNFGAPNTNDFWIVKIDASGNKQWDRRFGGIALEDEYGNTIQTSDGGYLISGTSYSDISGNKSEVNLGIEQMWIIKTDDSGVIEWDKTIFTTGHDEKGLAIETTDGGYAMATYTNSWQGGYCTEDNRDSTNITYDYFLIKFRNALQPQANFIASQLDVCPKTCIDFTNLSVNSNSFQWIFNGADVDTSSNIHPGSICYHMTGQYDVTLIAGLGLQRDTLTLVNYINVFPASPLVTIVQYDDTLVSNTGFSTYQWYVNGTALAGATSHIHLAEFSGSYELYVTDSNGCSTNSGIVYVVTGIDLPVLTVGETEIYPNPAGNMFTIRMPQTSFFPIRIEIYNSLGMKVRLLDAMADGNNKIRVSTDGLATGLYSVRIGNYGECKRLVIRKNH